MNALLCAYTDCYDNDGVAHQCLREAITLGFAGECENLQHCDEYDCETCLRFTACRKEKRQAFLDAGGVPPN